MNGSRVEGVDDLLREVSGDLIGETVRLDLVREGRRLALEVVPIELAS